MNLRFDSKVVLITGAGSGIGKATALEFAASGAFVVANFLKREKETNALVAEINASGSKAVAVKADVTRPDEVKALVKSAVDSFGRIDVLVNNAGGLIQRSPIDALKDDLLEKVIDLNLKSIFLVTREVVPVMKRNHSGKIINVASIAGRMGGGPGSGPYSASKGAVIALTKNLARDLASFGIQVNAVAPGIIDTPFHDGLTSAEQKLKFIEQIPMKRTGTAGEIAGPILFLASDAASYITGETLEVNGGQWMD